MPIRKGALLAAGLAVALGGSVAAGAAAQAILRGEVVTPPPPTGQLQALLRHADPNATHLREVLTTSHAAKTLLAGGHDGAPGEPAYLACAHGIFHRGMEPPGVSDKAHPILCLVVLARGMVVTEVSFPSHYPDLHKLGQVQKL
jgi:hypothetical protein